MDPITAAALRRPFPPEHVGKLPKPYRKDAEKGQCAECGGFHGLPAMHLDFVGHAAVTARLLEVDPGWSWEPMALHPSGAPLTDPDGNLWIRLTVAGVTRVGVGDGANAKERISDAIRNAAMRFGVALDLWSKEDLTTALVVTDPEWLEATVQLIDGATTREELDAVGQRIAGAVNIDAVNPDDRRDLAARWRDRLAAITAEQGVTP